MMPKISPSSLLGVLTRITSSPAVGAPLRPRVPFRFPFPFGGKLILQLEARPLGLMASKEYPLEAHLSVPTHERGCVT